MSRICRFALFVGFTVLATSLLLALLEGVASIGLAIADHVSTEIHLAERLHTEYDPEIGWINLPSLRIDNMHGPGLSLETNSQRFRNRRDFVREVPPGKSRIICSGDSFTLGYGVSTSDAWCNRLPTLLDSVDAANLGQGGYGVHQS